MADEEKQEQNQRNWSESEMEDAKRKKIKNYENLIAQLKDQRDGVSQEMNREFREMRSYVQSNPEEGVLLSFLGGIAIGYLLGKLGDK